MVTSMRAIMTEPARQAVAEYLARRERKAKGCRRKKP
jgi:hypothetical protein